MKSLEQIENVLRAHLPHRRRLFHVERIGLFGSWARGDHTPQSDLDILVSLSEPLGLQLVSLHGYLQQLPGLKVDLVTEGAVIRKPLLWQSICEELVYV